MGVDLETLALEIGALLRGDASLHIEGCATLEDAGPNQVSFLANRSYANMLGETQAGAVILGPNDVSLAEGRNLLVADDPYFVFRQSMVYLHGFAKYPPPDISPQAHIDPTAVIGRDCCIQPLAYIGSSARIGDRSVIYPHCHVGEDVVIGRRCVLHPNVTVYERCVLGDRVVIHAGSVIGQDGFGYALANGTHHKIPQVGNVVIEDDVEMGANCVVDRATVGTTRVGKGTKMSDLVAIGHGSNVGAYNLLVAQVGLAGSVKTGAHVAMGGQVGVAGHLKIGDGAQLAAKAGVMTDVPSGEQFGGQPAESLTTAKRNVIAIRKLPALIRQCRKLEIAVEEMQAKLGQIGSEAPKAETSSRKR